MILNDINILGKPSTKVRVDAANNVSYLYDQTVKVIYKYL
jgi:hypothetical protein